ncbi:DUF2029 domain-containing protein, partial [bacterium]|nr:DUF2029 domain-containing protein [bacterium]
MELTTKKQHRILGALTVAVWLVCSLQSLKGIDLVGYWRAVAQAWASQLRTPPYPVAVAQNGDFFQSPIAALLILPFTFLPVGIFKFCAWGWSSMGLAYWIKRLRLKSLSVGGGFVLICWFTHSISDVFLSLNFIFMVAVLLWLSHVQSFRPSRGAPVLAGLAFSLALALRPTPVALAPIFFLSDIRRRCLPWIFIFLMVWGLITTQVFPDSFLWWTAWLKALPLYSQAVDPRAATFQTPLANLDRMLTYLLHWAPPSVATAKAFMGIGYWLFASFCALRAEKRGERDLAFALLLSSLYCSFGPVWAAGFFFCLPLFAWALKTEGSVFLWTLTFFYSISPKWLWPAPLWEFGAATLGLPGWLIILNLALCWTRVWQKL